MSYFFKPLSLKADIERHRKKEQELIENINSVDVLTESGEIHWNVYNFLLDSLRRSKAELTCKIGKK
jgi:hypothetical protein